MRAGRLVDVVNERVLRDQAVIVHGDRIQEIVDARAAPRGPDVIDLSDFTVLPGLMDMHAHLAGQCDTGQGYAGLVTRTGAQEALAGSTTPQPPLHPSHSAKNCIGPVKKFLGFGRQRRLACRAGGVSQERLASRNVGLHPSSKLRSL